MRNKHTHIPEHSALLKTIYNAVDAELDMDARLMRRMLWLKFAFYITAASSAYAGLYLLRHPALFTLCFILYGFAALLLAFNFAHDLSHNAIFKSKRRNNFFYTCLYTLVGAHAAAWKERHIQSHHYAPNVKDYDSDLKISGLIRVIPNSPWRRHHRFQHMYAPLAYTTYSLFWVFVKDFVILYSADDYVKNKNRRYHLLFWLQKIFYLLWTLALPMLFSPQPWYVVAAAFIAMHLAQSLFLLFTFFMTHHVESTAYPETDGNGIIDTSWLMNQVKSSNDMHPFSETANFILGGFNNHIAHHLFPHISHIYYPRLNRILYRVLRENGITPNETTYFGGICSHLRLLKRMSLPENGLPQKWVKRHEFWVN
jgi:linoleoyl-CoA desaturase